MKLRLTLLAGLLTIVLNNYAQTIATGVVSSPKCAATTFNLTFTKTGTFTAANIFTAQLSNASGSFTTPVAIGTLTSTAAGTIVARIPSNTPTGAGYRIRVISSAPVKTGTINNSNITINALVTPDISINSSASGSICSSTSATLTAVALNGGTSPVYSWYKNGISVGTSSNVYSASSWIDKDSIICVLTSNASCVTSTKDTSNLKVMDVYRDTLSSWRRRNDLFHPELSHEGNPAFSIGNYGYVLFGDSIWRYDPIIDIWQPLTQYPGAGIAAGIAFAIGNKAYIGFGSGGEFYEYDVVSNVWTAKANYPGGLGNNCTFSIDDKGYVTYRNTFWCYNLASDTWVSKANIPSSNDLGLNNSYYKGFAFSIAGKGYAGGGMYSPVTWRPGVINNWCGPTAYKNDFYEYDPLSDIWTRKADQIGTGSCSFVIGNSAYLGLLSGYYDDCRQGYYVNSHPFFRQYNPLSDTWLTLEDFAGIGRFNSFAFSIGGRAFVGGGIEKGYLNPPAEDTLFHDFYEYKNIISTDSIYTSYCPGQNISLSFNTNCKNFNSGNVFTAQISDRNGNFSNGSDIGIISSVRPGVINAQLHNGLPSGSNYRIRIISSDPYYIGNEVPIVINPIVTPIAISGTRNIYGCNASTYTYSVEYANTAGYIWSVSGIGNSVSSGQGTNLAYFNLVNPGIISVVATIINICGTTTSSANINFLNEPPTVPSVIKKQFNPDIEVDSFVNPYLQSTVNSSHIADTFRIRKVFNAKSYLWSVPDSASFEVVNDTTIAVVFKDFIKITPSAPQYIKVSAVSECAISLPLLLSLTRNFVFSDDSIRIFSICTGRNLILKASNDSVTTVADADGNVYPTVRIGNQLWMSKNLAVRSLYSSYYNTDSTIDEYGLLYNDISGISPAGWHIPGMREMNDLQTNLQNYNFGGKLKESGFTHWIAPNEGATNEYGFNGLPGGSSPSYSSVNISGVGDYGLWWTSELNPVWWEHGWPWDFHWVYYPIYFKLNSGSSDVNYDLVTSPNFAKTASVRCLRDAPALTYLWSNGATTRTISVNPTVSTNYYCTISDGLGFVVDTFKVSVNNAIPTAPSTIYGAADVCPSFTSNSVSAPVRYYVRKVSNTNSYTWTMPAGATLVSGQGDTAINVSFSNVFVSGVISVISVNSCGISSARSLTVYKRIAAAPSAVQKEFAPTSILAVTSVCGLTSSIYRIKKVTYATSYNWSLNIGSNATITHVNASGINDTAVVVNFLNGFTKDTLSVKSVTACNISLAKTVIMNAALLPPAVTSISGKLIPCIGEVVVFVASSTAPTTAQSSISVFRWTKPNYTVITYANTDSSVINLQFNTGFTGGSITSKGQSLCGISGTAKSVTLQYLPPTPTSITSSTGLYNACIGSPITFTAVIPALSTTQRTATVYRWTKPNNTTILSATVDSLSITLQFNAGYTGGSLTVKGQTACGATGTAKSQALTHTACPTGTKNNPIVFTKDKNDINFNVTLFPNPTTTGFILKVFSAETKTASIKIMDVQGRLIKTLYALPQQTISFGNDFKSGVYMLEVSDGLNKKSIRAVKY